MYKLTIMNILALIICLWMSIHIGQVKGDRNVENQIAQIIQRNPASVFDIQNMREYNKIVEGRSYPIVLLFTVGKDLESQCQICPQIKQLFHQIASVYKKGSKKYKKAYFGVLHYKPTMQSIAQRLQIQNIPSVVILQGNPKSTPTQCQLQKESIPDCISRTLGIRLDTSSLPGQHQQHPGSRPQPPTLPSQGSIVMLGLIAMGVLVFLFYRSLGWYSIFFSLNMGSFVLCVGGIVFCLINNPPSFTFNGRAFIFFYPQQQQMLYLEGFIAAGMMVITALSILAVSEIIPKFNMKPWLKRLFSFICAASFFCGVFTVLGFFLLKNRWYLSGSPLGQYMAIYSTLLHQ